MKVYDYTCIIYSTNKKKTYIEEQTKYNFQKMKIQTIIYKAQHRKLKIEHRCPQ